MTLLALGINHKTAPVSLRERVTFSPESIDEALTSLLQQPLVQGGVVLSTCNRTELYLSVEQQEHMHEQLVAWLCAYHNLRPEEVKKSLYWHQGNDAVSHLMRVASGLDSLVLGEPQILGQVKKAFAESQRGQSLSGELERLFQKSFSVAKRVRTETDIGASAVSVAFAACTLARQIFESLADLNVLLVGAGETIELVARHLREHKVRHMIIANRTRERAQLLADEVGAEVITLPEIDERLADADIIISSTASPLPIIGKGMVERAEGAPQPADAAGGYRRTARHRAGGRQIGQRLSVQRGRSARHHSKQPGAAQSGGGAGGIDRAAGKHQLHGLAALAGRGGNHPRLPFAGRPNSRRDGSQSAGRHRAGRQRGAGDTRAGP